jgi:thioredoxin-related protein
MQQKTNRRILLALPALLAGIFLFSLSTQAEPASTDHAAWMTDFEAAKAKASAEKKPLLVDFTGSDWCGWCIKLDNEVFSKKAFKDYAKENLILVEIDFPRKQAQTAALKAQNEALAKKYGVRGFPTILILDAAGEVIEQTGYRRGGPDKYIAHLQEILAGVE